MRGFCGTTNTKEKLMSSGNTGLVKVKESSPGCFIKRITVTCLLIMIYAGVDEASAGSFIVKLSSNSSTRLAGHLKKMQKTADMMHTPVKHIAAGVGLVKIDAGDEYDVVQALSKINILPGQILYIEPDFKRSIIGIPNDADYAMQTGLKAIAYDNVWDKIAENREVVVGVIDTGIDINHPDLTKRIWKNAGEDWLGSIAQNNALDDEGDGYADNYFGVNILTGNGNPIDDNGHGSSIAGIIAAECNNIIGICGVSRKATILPIKVLDAWGDGSASDFIAAVDYLINFKKRTGKPVIINASLGGYGYSQAERDVLALAGQEGILVIAAAGNDHLDNDFTPLYPASYDLPNMISVASVKDTGQLSYFSSWGKSTVDVAAPGEQVYTTRNGGGYHAVSGTSFSAPFVAGIAAVMQSVNPSAGLKVKDYILGGAIPQATLTDVLVTGGMVNLSGTADQSAQDLQEVVIPLNKGQNLVSFSVSPLYFGDSAIRSGKDNIDIVWQYGDGVWNSYMPVSPGFSDLSCFGAGEGYWVDAKDVGAITIAGFADGEWPILTPGWNLVGFPVAVNTAVADVLAQRYSGVPVEAVWGYVDGQWRSYVTGNVGMSDLIDVEAGKGYWLKSNR
ncbi:MAG: hypothetical protein A2W23_08840 [Planctomycetes bacterium RBG_16_43_13]|nr:MAG: hypothetical protein A2W23_08840 [Planctomycetes bacterium RBG_16_43_13]